MWIIVIICLIAILYLAIRFVLVKMEIKYVRNQLMNIKKDASSNQLIQATMGKSCSHLINDINEMLLLQIEERRKYRLRDQAIKEELANISHDFRTPLTAIKGYSQILSQDYNLDYNQKEYLTIMIRKINLLERQVEKFYDLTLIESQDYPVQLAFQPLKNLMDNVLMTYYKEMEANNIILKRYELTKDDVLMDEDITKRILNNLFSNVLKHGEKQMSIYTQVQDDTLVLSIMNHIQPNHVVPTEKIFERTYTTQSNRKDGVGLGLYIVRSLVRLQKGTVEAKQENDTFTILVTFKLKSFEPYL
ncbi:sensor histidine kinase [Staphylococcus felis]|uniref:histidine kinase n=2 Tax=Staphylococcus felis TaxID=46127 RepID=A0ABS0QRP3_9STAP|nr:HAMP domain-containing sensor histidine kinase [Staphylococcus felis]MBH9581779.1 HAMP domain-containing histidine kinase [Staphylococcus felis]